jgi:hypothetical protein
MSAMSELHATKVFTRKRRVHRTVTTKRHRPHNLARLDILDAKRRELFYLIEARKG